MAEIITQEEEQKGIKKNLQTLKKAWIKFISFDKFTGGAVIAFALLITATPIIVSTMQTLAQNAETVATPPAIYFGVSAENVPTNLAAVSQFEQDAGKHVSVIMFYTRWGDANNGFNPAAMDAIRSHGAIPEITWEPWSGQITDTKYQLKNIINGAYDSYIAKFALDAKAWNHPFFLRFAHEMNGNWYPWDEKINNNKPGEYTKAWQHVHNIFTNAGVTNVTWVWSPNAVCDPYVCSTDLASFYPGDNYTDWVGMDGYSRDNNWQSFSEIFTKTYTDLTRLSPTKPLMISEMGVTEHAPIGESKATWITDAFTTQLPNNFPRIKAVTWFNFDKSNQNETDWRIESSQDSQQAFAKAVATPYYMDNQYNLIIQSPIPPIGEYTHPTEVPSIQPSVSVP